MGATEPRTLSYAETCELLAAGDIAVSASRYADGVDEAANAAADLRPPYVLKAGGLNHKSDAGGVVVGLRDLDEVRDHASRLLTQLGPEALPLILQRQERGTEVLLGIRREPRLGAVLVVGMGGIHAEVFNDVARALVPFDAGRARELLERLRGWPLLRGHRNSTGVDVEALASLMVTLAALADERTDVVELDLNPVLVGPVGEGVAIVDARAVVAVPQLARPRPDGSGLDAFVGARSVAVVGAGDDPRSVGRSVLSHLLDHGFTGRVVPVHPRGGEVRGLTRVPDLSQIPDGPVDLVCVAIGAANVPEVIRQAAELGSGAAIVHSSGFGEAGETGTALQRQIDDVIADTGMRVLGPNSMGLVALPVGIAASLSSTVDIPELRTGSISIVSSSGALGSCLAGRLLEDGLGLAQWISLGNESDIDAADCLEFLADDPETRVVGMILERLNDGPRFVRAARRAVSAGKAVFAYQLARSASAQAAAASHTGALVGSYALREAVLEEAGVVAVDSLEQLQDVLGLGAVQRLPDGGALGVLTASGGACTIIADEVADLGLSLPQLPESALAPLRDRLPAFASYANPLDATAAVINDPDAFVTALDAFADAALFDALLVQFTTNADPGAAVIAEKVVEITRLSTVPVYVARYGAEMLAPRALDVYRQAGLQILHSPEQLVRAVGALVRAGENRRRVGSLSLSTQATATR